MTFTPNQMHDSIAILLIKEILVRDFSHKILQRPNMASVVLT